MQIGRQKEQLKNAVVISGVVFSAILAILLMALHRNKERKTVNQILENNNKQIRKQKQLLEKTLEELTERGKKLAEANASKDRFFSIIAHDLKSPFSSILGISELLADGFDELSPAEQKEAAGRILESSRTVYNLLENLLHWARSQTKQIVPDPEIITIEDLIIKPLAIYRNAANAQKIRLETDIQPGLQVYADKGMMETVIRNLLSNAIKFTYPDGRVTVESRRHNEKGTGLGLILSRGFVEMNGDSLTAESVPGKGSAFTLTIPAYSHLG